MYTKGLVDSGYRIVTKSRPLLDTDLARYLRVHRAVVLEYAGLLERVTERLIRVERRRLEDLRRAHHRVWDIIAVRPGHGRPHGHFDRGHAELEVVDLDGHRFRRLAALTGLGPRPKQHGQGDDRRDDRQCVET